MVRCKKFTIRSAGAMGEKTETTTTVGAGPVIDLSPQGKEMNKGTGEEVVCKEFIIIRRKENYWIGWFAGFISGVLLTLASLMIFGG